MPRKLFRECDSALFQGFFELGSVRFRGVDPGSRQAVVEAGGGVFDSVDADEDVVDGQRSGFAVETNDWDLDELQLLVRQRAEWFHGECVF